MTTDTPTAASVTEALNRSARRILRAGRQADWSSAVLDAALEFCGRAALFTRQGARLELEAASFELAAEVSIGLADGPALMQTLESLEPIVSAWSGRELSAAVAAAFGNPRTGHAYLLPVAGGGKAVGLLIAQAKSSAPPADINGLELVCALAGVAWELKRTAVATTNGLIALTSARAALPSPGAGEETEWHRRAQRFASVRVAELRLYQAAKVKEGRESGRLYDVFREEIERERATFRTEFLEKSPSMADYLHEELVRTLAQGEASRMGESYPGAMVRS
jgi:hypothetical protein